MTDLRKVADTLEMTIPYLPAKTATLSEVEETIEELRQTLAQPEQEPMAWGIANTRPTEKNPLMSVQLYEPAPSHLVIPLYTAPPSIEAAVLSEREACIEWLRNNYQDYKSISEICEAIRARGEK